MARQPASKYQPTRFGRQVPDQWEVDGDEPLVDPQSFAERVESFIDIQLTDAQIRALAAAPVQLIAAPGAGRAIVVDSVYLFVDVAVAYDDAAADGNLNVKYAGGADASAGFNIEADGVIDAVADAARFYPHAHDYVAGAALIVTPTANTAVQLDNDGAEFTGGDAANTLSVRVRYHIVDVAAFT